MRTREAAVREAWKTDDDRGAVLFILLLFLVIFIAVATLAVDLAAQGARAQDLQNTSDAAALAGVVEYQERILAGDTPAEAELKAEAVIEELMRQNGLDPDSGRIDLDLVISDDGSQLEVIITDNNPDQFLPNDLLGETIKLDDSVVTRSATAEFLACTVLCNITVEIKKSLGLINAPGEGDGYKPILVNNKLYALNHNTNERTIVCISTITQQPCWSDGASRTAYSNGVAFDDRNPEMPQTAVVGSRIYWAATDEGSGHRLFCWDTSAGLDIPCPNAVTLNSGLYRYDTGDADNILVDNKDENRGGGTFTVFGQKVFTFTDDHRIHCWDPASNSICSGYVNGGNPTALDDFPALSPVDGNHGSSIDRIVDQDTGYVYSTLHIPYAKNFDCTSPLADPAGKRVVVINEGTGRYLSSDNPDDVFASSNGGDIAAWWDVENFGDDTVTFQSAAHGEYLAASPFASTSAGGPDEEDRWNTNVLVDTYHIDSDNLDFAAGALVDNGGFIGQADPPITLEAEWNFYPWQCGVDPSYAYSGPDYFVDGTWLHCYDTGTVSGAPGTCPGFSVSGVPSPSAPAPTPTTPTPIHPDGTRFSGRLWFFYDTTSPPNAASKLGICSSGYGTWNRPVPRWQQSLDPASIEVNCVRISDGNYDAGMSAEMDPLVNEIRTNTGWSPGAWGDPHWNAASNRLFYPVEHDSSNIICYDFTNRSYCGEATKTIPVTAEGYTTTHDYGFISEGNCVYALGHTSYFWAFTADDIGEPCSATIPPVRLPPCECGVNDTKKWRTLDFSDIDLDLVDVFGVRIMTDDGGDGSQSLPIYPSDGSFHSLKPGGASLRIPLDDLQIPEDAESILIAFDVQGLDEDQIETIGRPKRLDVTIPKLVD